MHEMSIMAQVFQIIKETKEKHKLGKITSVELKVGQLTCVEESALQFAFSAFAASYNLQEAELKIDWVRAQAKCQNCGRKFEIKWRDKVCPNCNNFCNNLISGDELYLNRIEGE